MARYLEDIVKAGRNRAGPIEGYLATHDTVIDESSEEGIIRSSYYEEYNTDEEVGAMYVWEIGATKKFSLGIEDNARRVEEYKGELEDRGERYIE